VRLPVIAGGGQSAAPRKRFRLPGADAALSRYEREILLSVAQAALPGGEVFPRAGAWTAAKLDSFLATVPPAVRAMFRTVLWGIEAYALARRRRRFAKLYPAEQAQLLEAKEKDAGLLVERLGFLNDGRAAEFTQSYYRGDIYDFVAELSVSS